MNEQITVLSGGRRTGRNSTFINYLANTCNRTQREILLSKFSADQRAEIQSAVNQKCGQRMAYWPEQVQRMALKKLQEENLTDYQETLIALKHEQIKQALKTKEETQ